MQAIGTFASSLLPSTSALGRLLALAPVIVGTVYAIGALADVVRAAGL